MALATLLAAAGVARAGAPRAVVVTTDFETGMLSTVRTAAPHRVRRLGTHVFSDAIVRVTGGYAIVLNRFLADNVQVLSRRLRTRLQCGTGAGSNPHDVVVATPGRPRAEAGKAYVTRYGGRDLWIVDPAARGCGGFRRGTIDLSGCADADGLPEMDQMALVGDRLFVTLQRLDRRHGFVPTDRSEVAVVDTMTDALVTCVALPGRNAFGDASGIVREPGGDRLAISMPGDLYTVGDGGVGWLDPATLEPSPTFFLDEAAVAGNVTDFVFVDAATGYAIVQGEDLRNAVWRFDPTAATPPVKVIARDGFLPDLARAPDGTVWIADQSRPNYGIRILDPATGDVSRPIAVGLPPFSMGFLP